MHSYTGSVEEMLALVQEGMYIGVNGLSMATEEGMEMVKQIPVDKIMIESIF